MKGIAIYNKSDNEDFFWLKHNELIKSNKIYSAIYSRYNLEHHKQIALDNGDECKDKSFILLNNEKPFFAFIGINLGLINVMIAHTVFCIPFAYMPIKASLEAMDPTLEVAARDLYSDRNSTFRYITLPLLMPGILSGFMLAFVISIDDFIITLMVAGGGSTTLPVYIYSMIKMGVTPEVNAISTLMLAFSIILVTGYWVFSKKS